MWKKILFIGIAIVIGIGVYFLGYNSNQANHIYDLVGGAIDSGNYVDVARTLGGCFDTHSIAEDSSDDYDIVVYPATSLSAKMSYGEDQVFYHYENAYYFYLFKTRFSVDKTSSGVQKTGFRFYGEKDSYDYYFVVNQNTNSDFYEGSPANLEDVLLKQERQCLTSSDIKFVNATLTESQLTLIEEKTGRIDKVSILNSSGEEVDSLALDLSFSQAFFQDLNPFVSRFDQYLQDALAAEGDKKKSKELSKEFEAYSNDWEHNTFPAMSEEKGYTLRFSNDVLSPASLVWKTIGMLALYALVIVIFYILLFHFKSIKRIFSRETYKDYGGRGGTYVNGKREDAKSKEKPVKAEVVDSKEKNKGDE